MGTWESSATPKTLEFDYKGPNISSWNVFYIIKFLSKCRCRKWACMNHLDICSTSYGKKKGRESNWQFDSWPLKVRNQFDLGVYTWNATHCWKALKKIYKFTLDLILIGGLSKKLWARKVPGVQTGTILGILLGRPWTKSYSDVGAIGKHREYYMGEGDGFPRVRAMVSLVSPGLPVACLSTKGAPTSEVGWFDAGLRK
jgi:hypothetical protein